MIGRGVHAENACTGPVEPVSEPEGGGRASALGNARFLLTEIGAITWKTLSISGHRLVDNSLCIEYKEAFPKRAMCTNSRDFGRYRRPQ
jgi:hypothetical protein